MSMRKTTNREGLLPELASLPRRVRTEITYFGGLSAMGKGCLAEMSNLSARGRGALTTRTPRGAFTFQKGDGLPLGMIFFDGSLFYARGGFLYATADGETERMIGSVNGEKKVFFVFNDCLYIYPDKLYVKRGEDRLYTLELDSGVVESAEFSGSVITLPSGMTWSGLGFSAGDGLRVQNADDDVPAPEGYYHIVSVRGRSATVKEYLSTSLTSKARFLREVPDLDAACVSGRRVYGIREKSIYVSAEGSATDFFSSKGSDGRGAVILSADGEGDLTACAPWQGYVIFFKSDRVYKLLGNQADSFVLQERTAVGIPGALAGTLCEVGGDLYYCSGGCVFRYRGQDPEQVAPLVGGAATEGCAGSDGQAYYLAITQSGADWRQYVYLPLRDEWYAEDVLHVVCMAQREGFLYLLGADGNVWVTSSDGRDTGCRFTEEDDSGLVEATAVLPPDYHLQPSVCRPVGLYIRATAAAGASMEVLADYADGYAGKDADGTAPVSLGHFEGGMTDRLLRVRMPSNSCDGVKVILRMKGDWVIHAVMREYA